MTKTNPANERIKRNYLIYLKEAKGQSVASVDHAAAAIDRFQDHTGHRDFKAFTTEQARSFKQQLARAKNPKTGRTITAATMCAILTALRGFTIWLADQPGYRSRIQYSDADYFSPSGSDARIAQGRREPPSPSLEQVRHMIEVLPTEGEIAWRNRAVVAFIALTGARDGAVASFKLKHVDIRAGRVHQDAREVRTKGRKTFDTWFFPVGDDIRAIVEDWVRYLTEVKLWGPDDPLFPATRIGHVAGEGFQPLGLDRRHWAGAGPIREIFKAGWAAAGLPYYRPHSLRHTLTQVGLQMPLTPEELKAWSQNFGHEKVLTTLNSYGTVQPERQAEIIRRLGVGRRAVDPMEKLAELVAKLEEQNRSAPT